MEAITHISRISNAARHPEKLLDDAIDNANEAARTWITVELEEEDPIFPHVSDLEDIELAEDEIVRNISVNIRFYEGWDE